MGTAVHVDKHSCECAWSWGPTGGEWTGTSVSARKRRSLPARRSRSRVHPEAAEAAVWLVNSGSRLGIAPEPG